MRIRYHYAAGLFMNFQAKVAMRPDGDFASHLNGVVVYRLCRQASYRSIGIFGGFRFALTLISATSSMLYRMLRHVRLKDDCQYDLRYHYCLFYQT